MPGWRQLVSLINFCTVYYTTQLVRCAAFSFVLIGLVMLLRKILRRRLWKSVAKMEKVMFENVHIYVTDMNITPFTIGLLKNIISEVCR